VRTKENYFMAGKGIGIDNSGGPVIDPTENVKALSESSHKRQDDLRIASDRLTDERVRHLAEIVVLNANHGKELRQAESNRLDAIRQVDVKAREADAQRSQDALKTLEATTATMRETLRADVAVTASTIATQSAARDSRIDERISKLELAMSKGEGRSTGLNFGWEKLVALVGLLGGLIGLFVFFSR
jgi:hypothetical protein